MFSKGLKSWSDGEWLGTRVDKWVAQCQGYSRLRSRRLARVCHTMLDRPSPQNLFWSRSDSELLNDLPDLPRTEVRSDNNVNISSLSLNEPVVSEDTTEDTKCEHFNAPVNLNFSEKQMQYDQDIADYIAYLNKPIINMNDHYIEIHQYHYEPSNFIGSTFPPEEVPIRPPTRRKKHKTGMRKAEIVETNGVNPLRNSEYSEFLVKKGTDCNQNITIVPGKSSDKENKEPGEDLDVHRPLSQTSTASTTQLDTVVTQEGHVKVKRGQTFTSRSLSNSTGEELPHRGFLSFRTTKKNKNGRRKKKVVVGEEGVDGPIWPAVLLTFDRSISPAPAEASDESEV